MSQVDIRETDSVSEIVFSDNYSLKTDGNRVVLFDMVNDEEVCDFSFQEFANLNRAIHKADDSGWLDYFKGYEIV